MSAPINECEIRIAALRDDFDVEGARASAPRTRYYLYNILDCAKKRYPSANDGDIASLIKFALEKGDFTTPRLIVDCFDALGIHKMTNHLSSSVLPALNKALKNKDGEAPREDVARLANSMGHIFSRLGLKSESFQYLYAAADYCDNPDLCYLWGMHYADFFMASFNDNFNHFASKNEDLPALVHEGLADCLRALSKASEILRTFENRDKDGAPNRLYYLSASGVLRLGINKGLVLSKNPEAAFFAGQILSESLDLSTKLNRPYDALYALLSYASVISQVGHMVDKGYIDAPISREGTAINLRDIVLTSYQSIDSQNFPPLIRCAAINNIALMHAYGNDLEDKESAQRYFLKALDVYLENCGGLGSDKGFEKNLCRGWAEFLSRNQSWLADEDSSYVERLVHKMGHIGHPPSEEEIHSALSLFSTVQANRPVSFGGVPMQSKTSLALN